MGFARPPYYFTAYGLAVKHGFQGTEQEWLETLRGDKVQLRYQDGILQWKWVTSAEDQWQDLFDLSKVQDWVDVMKAYHDACRDYWTDTERAAQDVQATTEELYQKVEALAKSVTTRMVVDFELGGIYTETGVEVDVSNRIRSDYFPNLSGKLRVVAPDTVKSFLVYYDSSLAYLSASAFKNGSYTVETDAAFARLVVSYADDTAIEDVEAVASAVAVYMPVELPEWMETFTVTITGNDSDGYAADKRIDDIQNAVESGQSCVCRWGMIWLPLVLWEDTTAHFATVVDGQERRVEIGQETVTAVCEALGGDSVGEMFEVTVTGDYEWDQLSADHTYAEILEAHKAGKKCVCYWEYCGTTETKKTYVKLPLIEVSGQDTTWGSLNFSAVFENKLINVHFTCTGHITGTVQQLSNTEYFSVYQYDDGTFDANMAAHELELAFSHSPETVICQFSTSSYAVKLSSVSVKENDDGSKVYVFAGVGRIPDDEELYAFSVTAAVSAESELTLTSTQQKLGQSVLPVASPDTLGGVQPVAKTEDMTQSVGVDELGGLWANPNEDYECVLLADFTSTEELTRIAVESNDPETSFKRLLIELRVLGSSTNTAVTPVDVVIKPSTKYCAWLPGFANKVQDRLSIAFGVVDFTDVDMVGSFTYCTHTSEGGISASNSYLSTAIYQKGRASREFIGLSFGSQNGNAVMDVGSSVKVWGVK